MPGIFALVALVIGYMLSGNYHPSQTATTTPIPTVIEKTHVLVTATSTPTITDTPTPTESPTSTNTPTATPKPTWAPTATPKPTPIPTASVTYATATPTPVPVSQNSGGSYTCDCSKTCPNMSSCAEAQYQLNVCGCTARDADHDGTACDAQCQ